jgi:hypothetical protein
MSKLQLLFIVLFLIYLSNIQAQTYSDVQKLEKTISDQINSDLKDQSDSYYLFPLKVAHKKDLPDLSLSSIDSTNFIFQDGCYLRFYLICSGDSDNIATLKLYRKSNSPTIPKTLIKEMNCRGNESKILIFDYYLKDIEAFDISLSLENNRRAIAVAVATQYIPK